MGSKTFVNVLPQAPSPALNLIQQANKEPVKAKENKAKEIKDRRLNLLTRPSTWEAINTLASIDGISFNEEVNRLFDIAIKNRSDEIEAFNNLFRKGDK